MQYREALYRSVRLAELYGHAQSTIRSSCAYIENREKSPSIRIAAAARPVVSVCRQQRHELVLAHCFPGKIEIHLNHFTRSRRQLLEVKGGDHAKTRCARAAAGTKQIRIV